MIFKEEDIEQYNYNYNYNKNKNLFWTDPIWIFKE